MLTIIKSLKQWFTALALTIGFLFFILISIPIILESNSIQRVLSGFMSTQFLTGVKPDKITFSIFPFPAVELSDIIITKAPLQNSTIEKVVIYFSLESLIDKKIILSKITIQNPAIPLSSALLSIPVKGKNLFDYLPDEQENFSIEINNLTSDTFKSADILINLSPSSKTISGDITLNRFILPSSLNLIQPGSMQTDLSALSCSVSQVTGSFIFKEIENFHIDLTLANLLINFTDTKEQKIQSDKIVCNVVERGNRSAITIKNIGISPFSSSTCMQFKHNRDNKETALIFSGKQVNLDAVRPAVLQIMPNNLISKKIFNILQGGLIENIEILFKSRDLPVPLPTNSHWNKVASHSLNSKPPIGDSKQSTVDTNYREIETPLVAISNFLSEKTIRAFFNPLQMTIKGELKNGSIKIPATKLIATKTDAMVSVQKGILHTEITQGQIDISKVNKGRLDVDLLNENHDFTGEFDISADLAHLNTILQTLLPASPVSKELITLKDINGNATGTLTLKGQNNHRPSISVSTGDITLNGRYPRLPEKFSITGGQFTYSDDMVTLSKINGKIGKSVFSNLSASFTLDGKHLLKISSGTAQIVLEELLPWLASLSNNISSILPDKYHTQTSSLLDRSTSGTNYLSLFGTNSILAVLRSLLPLVSSSAGELALTEAVFQGRVMEPITWDYLFQGKCNKTTLRQQSYEDEISDINAEFLLSPSITKIFHGNATIHNTALISTLVNNQVVDDRIKINNHIMMPNDARRINDIKTPFTITDAYFQQNSDINGTNKTTLNISGRVVFNEKIQLYLSGKRVDYLKIGTSTPGASETEPVKSYDTNRDNSIMQYQIKIFEKDIETATISYDIKQRPSVSFTGTLDTQTIEALFNPLSATCQSINTLTGGTAFTITSNQSGEYKINTKELDLNFILERQKMISQKIDSLPLTIFSSKEASLISTEPPLPIVITINCEKFIHKKVTLSPFSARIDINKEDKKITIENMKLCNVNGSTTITIKKNLMELFITLNDENKNIEPVISCLYHGDRLIQGNYSLKASLYSWARLKNDNMDSIKALKNNLTGTIEATSDKGRIFRLTLLSRILSVINISKLMEGKFPDIEQNGFAFNSIKIIADMKKGRIILKQAVINGLDMTLLFAGSISPFTGAIDLICLVAPFKTADSIIKTIPIINTMLSGRLISVPVKAVGTLNNPDVTVLLPSEVAKNILKTMQDILTTPFKLINVIQ